MVIPRALLFPSDLAQLTLTTIIGRDDGASVHEGVPILSYLAPVSLTYSEDGALDTF